MKNKCLAKGCEREIKVKKHGLCMTHAKRYYRTGKVGGGVIVKRKNYKPYKPTK